MSMLHQELAPTLAAPSLIGIARPVIVAVDNGASRTRINVKHGEDLLGTVQYDTPQNYEIAQLSLGEKARELANGRHISAVGFAVAGQVEDRTIVDAGQLKEYGWCGRDFAGDAAVTMQTEPSSVVLLNDCGAAGTSQMFENRKSHEPDSGYTETISTGWGGAGFKDGVIQLDEPGHEFLRSGAICGCGRDGCAEAHISGSGIERKFGLRGEDLPADKWVEVIADTVEAHAMMLHRFAADGFEPRGLYFFGSVALKGRGLVEPAQRAHDELRTHGVLQDLRDGLMQLDREGALPFLPKVCLATNGDDSGIIGAEYAARELLTA